MFHKQQNFQQAVATINIVFKIIINKILNKYNTGAVFFNRRPGVWGNLLYNWNIGIGYWIELLVC